MREPRLSAEQILSAAEAVYAGCRSYRDRGQAVTVFVGKRRGRRTVIKPFETAFGRPDRFRFEFRHRAGEGEGEWDRYIVWARDAQVRTWWDLSPGVKERDSLRAALQEAGGVSGGVSVTVPALLLPESLIWWRLRDLTEVRLLEEGDLNGLACYRISGVYADIGVIWSARGLLRYLRHLLARSPDLPLTVWIDQKSFLVKRVETQDRFRSFHTESIVSYEAAIDMELVDDELEFRPPVPTA